jgi:CubicO group peptidase (beta-lactamase class C family)
MPAAATAAPANGVWTVVLLDFARAVTEKRGAQLGLMLGKLLPKGGERESFAGKPARELDAARVAQLVQFVELAEQATQIPGVAFGLLQQGKVVYARGVGVRERGKPIRAGWSVISSSASC